uniref:HEPN domain-containing protein n=1 Tax=Candidatus Methanogaster sp. ANME-2c ERB4 TaxID=2759911 RepID=A0A7G9YEA3_9EURY|nr:hypothetical protein PABHDKJJ_00041 [Methanosarcinales archaeon ANME-2c ERB4]
MGGIMRKEVRELWKQAKRDLITAENCKNSKDYYACAFFCQQSVEKGFKGTVYRKKADVWCNPLVDLPRHRDRHAIRISYIPETIDARVRYHAVSGCGLWNAL